MYIDETTGTSQNVTLSQSTNSYTIRNLTPGQTYRIKLVAIVDGNQVEVTIFVTNKWLK